MKKNDRIIKALAVGLSAAMMLQPMAAVAAEIEEVPDNNSGENKVEEVAEKEVKVYEAQATLADTAKDVHDFYGEGLNYGEPFLGTVGDVDRVIRDTDALLATGKDGEIKKAEGALAVQVNDTELTVKHDELKIAYELEMLEKQDMKYIASDNVAKDAATEGNLSVSAGDAAAEEAMQIANTVSKNMATYQANINADREIINNATTVAQANAAFEDISANVAAADVSANSAASAFEDVSANFNTAKAEYEEANAKYEAAVKANKEATEKINKIANDVSANADEINVIVDKSSDNLETLQVAVEKAKKKYLETGMGYIYSLEKTAEAETNPNWRETLDPLFKALLEFYYIPEVEGGKYTSAEFVKNSDSDQNYFIVTYTDAKNETQVKYLNYKLAENNKSGGIVIFEKTEEYVAGEKTLEKSEVESAKNGDAVIRNDGSVIVMKDGKIYLATNKGKSVVNEEIGSDNSVNFVIGDGAKEVEISNPEITYSLEDGKLVETVIGDVNTTTYEAKTLLAGTAENEEAAKEAFVNAINELIANAAKDGNAIVINGEEYSSEVTYEDVEDSFRYTQIKENRGITATVTYYAKYNETVTGIELHSFFDVYVADEDKSDFFDYYTFNKSRADELAKKYTGILVDEHGKGYIDIDGDDKKEEIMLSEHEFEVITHQEYFDNYYTVAGDCDHYFVKTSTVDINPGQTAETAVGELGIYIKTEWKNGKYVAVYVPYKTETIILNEDSEALAKSALDAKLGANANAKILSYSAVVNEEITGGEYSELKYYLAKKSTQKAATISTAKFGNTEVANVVYTNEKFNNGDILLSEYNSDDQWRKDYDYINENGEKVLLKGADAAVTRELRKQLEVAEKKAEKYNRLLKDIENAQKDIDEIQKDIALLQAQIAAIIKGGTQAKLADFEAELASAKAILDAALAARDGLKDQLDEAQKDLDDTIRRLTPAPSNDDNGPSEEPAPVEEVVPVITPAPARVTPAPAVVAPVVEEAPEAVVEEVEIAEEEVPQAAVVEEVKEEKVEEPTPVVIEDNDTPLAPIDDAKQMSWWWILVVLVFGTTGAELFRRHQLKKNAAKVEE